MAFIYSMLICGIICALFQLLAEIKVPFPVAAIIFVVLGGVLTPLGFVDWLMALGPGGPAVTAIGCGNGAYGAGAALATGNFVIPVLVLGVNVLLVVLGALAGGPLLKNHPECLPPPPEKRG